MGKDKGWLNEQMTYAAAANKVSELNPFDVLKMAEQLKIARDALEFYAEEDNYFLNGGKLSLIFKDDGVKAAKAIASIDNAEVG